MELLGTGAWGRSGRSLWRKEHLTSVPKDGNTTRSVKEVLWEDGRGECSIRQRPEMCVSNPENGKGTAYLKI